MFFNFIVLFISMKMLEDRGYFYVFYYCMCREFGNNR